MSATRAALKRASDEGSGTATVVTDVDSKVLTIFGGIDSAS